MYPAIIAALIGAGGAIGSSLLGGGGGDTHQPKPMKQDRFQRLAIEEWMKYLFGEGAEEGEPVLKEMLADQWQAKKELESDYLASLDTQTRDLVNRLTAAQSQTPITVGLGDFSFPMTTGTQRAERATAQQTAKDIYNYLDTLAGRKLTSAEQYEIPYGAETEYFTDILNPLTQWSQSLRWQGSSGGGIGSSKPTLIETLSGGVNLGSQLYDLLSKL